jgi:hypothetical protein
MDTAELLAADMFGLLKNVREQTAIFSTLDEGYVMLF